MRRLLLVALMMLASASCAQFADDPFGESPEGFVSTPGGGGVPYVPKRLYWYNVGVGGGGWLHSGAFHPAFPNWVAVGGDISGAYISSDGGVTWRMANKGLTDSGVFDEAHYVGGIVGVQTDGFSGFVATTYGGIYKLSLGSDTWECMTPHTSTQQDYVYRWVRPWAPDGVGMSIPFSGIAWDGGGLLVAGGGRSRWRRSYFQSYYPNDAGVVAGSAPQATVWRCDLSRDSVWRPTALGNLGTCNGISVAEVNGDTLVVFATEQGIFLGRNFTELYDLSSRTVRFDGAKTLFNFTQDPHASTGHMPWYPHVTARGDIYVAIDYSGSTETASSGIYKMTDWENPASEWVWVGGSDDIAAWSAHFGRSFESHNATHGASQGPNHNGQMIELSVLDGQGTAPDTLFVGDRVSSLGLVRILSYHNGDPESETWEPMFYGDRTGGYVNVDLGWYDIWGCQVIFPPVLHTSERMIVQPNGRLQLLEGGAWQNVQTTDVGQPAPGYWKTSGYSELSVLDVDEVPGAGILWCAADMGPFLTYGENYAWQTWIVPAVVDADSSTNDASVYNPEASSAAVVADFNGTGRWVAAICYGDAVQGKYMGKVLSYGDIDNDGTPEFRNMCGDIPHPFNYSFALIASVGDDFYSMYYQKDETLSTVIDGGMMHFWWDGAAWHSAKVNNGLSADALHWHWNDMIYNAPSNRIYVAAGYDGATGTQGTILYYDLNKAVWGEANRDASDNFSLAQTPHGGRIYAGTMGMSGHVGTVQRCDDPTATPPVFTALFNMTAGDTPFGHGQPFEYEYASDLQANQRLTNVRAIAVDPQDTTQVWLGVTGDDDNYSYIAPGTLWLMRDTGAVQQLELIAHEGEEVRASRLLITGSHRLIVGTGGNDLWTTSLDSTRITW